METIKIWPGWEIKEQIGEGDFGKVFRMERTDSGITREAALKVIEISGDSSEIKMFRKMGMDEDSILEIYEERKNQLLTSIVRLSCLRTAYGIASVEDFDSFWNEEESSWTILVRSEFLESLDVYGKKKGGDLLPAEIAEMGRDIAGALMTLEKEGITTLSVKPSNILRNSEGSYKLSDAGINEGTGRLAASKVGTLFSWDAPELVRSGKYDQTSDIYSLGMVMYVLLNGGKRPFMEEGGVQKRWMQFRIANERRVAGEPLPKPVSGDEELQNIVLKACAAVPEDRYQNALELREALEIWLFGQKYGKRMIGTSAAYPDQPRDETEEKADNDFFVEVKPSDAVEIDSFPAVEQEAEKTSGSPANEEEEIQSSPYGAEEEISSEPYEAGEEIPSEPYEAEKEISSEPYEAGAETPSEPAGTTADPFSVSREATSEILSEPGEEPAAAEESEQFADLQEKAFAAEENDCVEEKTGVEFFEEPGLILPAGALEKAPVLSEGTDPFVKDQDEQESDGEGILHVKAEEEDFLSDAVRSDPYEGISFFGKGEEEREYDADLKAEDSSGSPQDEEIHEKGLKPFSNDFFSEPEPFQPMKDSDAEPEQSSEDLFHTPDLFNSSEENGTDQDQHTGMNSSAGIFEDSEVTALVSDEDRKISQNPDPFFNMHGSQNDSEKSLDDSVSNFFRTGADLDVWEQNNEELPVSENSQWQPEAPIASSDVFFGGKAQGPSEGEGPYGATVDEVPALEPAQEPKKEEIPPTADVFIYIFQRDDRLFGIHSRVSENAGGARLKMKSDVLETGLFEAIMDNLRNRTALPVKNAYVTIGSGASKEEYEERKKMVLDAGLESVTILDDAAVNALGFFADEFAGQEGEHYVLSVIHDYSGFHSSLLKFDKREGSEISVLKSAPTAKVVNPMENPAFIMDRMLQDNCRVDGVDYSNRVERILVDNRNRPLYGSVGQGSFDPYYNEVYGSIFQRAGLYEGIEVLKGLAYYDSCKKGKADAVKVSLSVFEEPVKETSEEYQAADSQENGSSAQIGRMGFGADNEEGFHGGEPAFRTEFGRDMADPNFSTMESTMNEMNPFGTGGDAFGSSPDPFGAGGDAFGSSPDPFGAGGDTFGSSPDPFGADGDLFNATVTGDELSGQTNGNADFGKNPFRDELTAADGFGGDALDDTASGRSHIDGFGEVSNQRAAVPSGISYSDRGRIYMLNEKKPINDVTMEVNDGGIDLFRKDIKIALAFGMIGSAIEGKGKKFAHIDFSQIRGFGYETPNPKTGQKPALYTADGKVYIFDFMNAQGTDNILRQIAGTSDRPF